MDCNSNVYVGDSNMVLEYDSTLIFKSTASLAGNVYDLKVTNNGLLYACGNGFVQAISIPSANI